MRLKRDKPGDALGRPSWQSWLLRDPGAKFLPQSGGKHEKYNLERMSTSITVQESEFEWPVLNRPQMAGFGVTTEVEAHAPSFPAHAACEAGFSKHSQKVTSVTLTKKSAGVE